MKSFLLFISIFFATVCGAQSAQVSTLPAGKYETLAKNNQNKWERGDIILLDDNKYKISTSAEVGDYKFSVSAQRVFFTSGPLKSLYARTSLNNNDPAIILPVAENEQQGLKLSAEIWGYYRH